MATAAFAEPTEQTPAQPGWPLERVLFALAGTMTLIAGALSLFVSRWFALLSAFIGINQWLFVLFGACPASLILRRLFSLPSCCTRRARARTLADRSIRPMEVKS